MKLAFRTDIASVDVSSNLRNKPELSVKENHCIAEDNFFSYGEGLKQQLCSMALLLTWAAHKYGMVRQQLYRGLLADQ